MASYTGFSPKSPNRYLAPNVFLSSVVTRNREPTGADYRQPETGKLYPISSFWLIGANPTTGIQGELWYLSKIVANVAFWLKFSSGGSGPLVDIEVPNGVTPIVPDGTGTINFTSSLGTITITGSSASPNNHTVNFDLAGGSLGIDSIAVQAITAPGVTPVLPTAAGLVTVNGLAVANHSVPIETRSRALNAYNIEVQYAAATAATDATKNGISHYSNAQFAVDVDGFVQLKGSSGAAVQTITGDDTTVVSPDASGNITLVGTVVSNATHAKAVFTKSPSANHESIDVQVSAAIASTDVTKVGLAAFDSARFIVDANGFVSSTGFINQGIANLGVSQSAGTTFNVNSANGTALSASNPAYVTLQNLANPGQLKTYTVTANQSFTQAQLGNNLFGVTSGVNITVAVPFYLYAVSNAQNGENAIAFMISRVPHRTVSPVAANIGQNGNTNATTAGSFFSLSAITAADYASSPCLCIGSFRMTYAASLWTIITLNRGDGIEQYQDGVQFAIPRGQFGAAASKYFTDNGGTAPNDPNGNAVYFITKGGLVNIYVALPDCTTAGVGAVVLTLVLPFLTGNGGSIIMGYYLDGVNTVTFIGDANTSASTTLTMRFTNLGVANARVENASLNLHSYFTLGGYYYASIA